MWAGEAGAKVCVSVRACACIGGCVGAEERIEAERGGREAEWEC